MDEDEDAAEGENSDASKMRDIITVECHKLNGGHFIGTVNFSEAKKKIFQDGLGLDADLLERVRINFNKCPVVTFKLKSKINITQKIRKQHISFTRTYHSKNELITDTITCKVLGVKQNENSPTNNRRSEEVQRETVVKVDGCDSYENACKIKNCLTYYGEIRSDITEMTHYDPDPNAQPVGNGSFQVKMRNFQN